MRHSYINLVPHRILAAGRLLMVLSLRAAVGLQWTALQSIAWAGMLVKYSQSGDLAAAVSKTFDGDHPCPLCKAIAKASGKKSESQQLPAARKFDMVCRTSARLLPPSSFDFRWAIVSLTAAGFSPEPPAPPPRAA